MFTTTTLCFMRLELLDSYLWQQQCEAESNSLFMESLEGKTLKELYAIRRKREIQREKEDKESLELYTSFRKKGNHINLTFNSQMNVEADGFGDYWHPNDKDLRWAATKIKSQESDAQDIRNIQEILGKSPNRNKANELKVPLVVWVGVVLLIVFIATKVF